MLAIFNLAGTSNAISTTKGTGLALAEEATESKGGHLAIPYGYYTEQ